MAKDPFNPDVSIVDFDRPAHVRAAPAPEYRRPKRVRQMAERANQLIAAFTRGGNAAVRAMLTPEELAARARDEQLYGSPEKVISREAFRELTESIEKDAGNVIPPEDALARQLAAMEGEGGRATPDDTQ